MNEVGHGLHWLDYHQNKLLFYLLFFRKLKFMFEFIFTVFRVMKSFMDGTVKEQRLRTKNVNA
jgi:hypothetical protein